MIIKKRFFDLFLAILLIVFVLPLFFIIYLYVYFQIGSPVIFKQERIGYKGKKFNLYKFRTMKNKNSKLVSNRKIEIRRVLAKTKFLRRTRLDEIPQLLNIIKGDLSFVGPRPLLEEYSSLYNSKQRKRMDVVPGITGWSQIKSRKNFTWKERFNLDIWYVDHRSFFLDLKIIILTVSVFFKLIFQNKKNIYMTDKFNGKN